MMYLILRHEPGVADDDTTIFGPIAAFRIHRNKLYVANDHDAQPHIELLQLRDNGWAIMTGVRTNYVYRNIEFSACVQPGARAVEDTTGEDMF